MEWENNTWTRETKWKTLREGNADNRGW
jgi:hypothetical protein